MVGVRPLGRLTLVIRAALQGVPDPNLLDHQDAVLDVDLALGLGAELAAARVYPARLQRAAQGAGESTGGRRHHVVERGRMLRILSRRGAVVLADRAVRAEDHWFRLGWQERLSDRAALADDPHPGDVGRVGLVQRPQKL